MRQIILTQRRLNLNATLQISNILDDHLQQIQQLVISEQTQIVVFWSDLVSREELRKHIWLRLEDSCLLPENRLGSLTDQLTQLAERHTSNQGQ